MKKYFSEILLITSIDSIDLFILWLYWHINIIGFDHIVVIDNSEQDINKIKNICKQFGDKVTHNRISGTISQSEIYTEYANKSDAYWVLPIDDDEFVYISEKYNHNIKQLLVCNEQKNILANKQYFKYAFSWLMMFSNEICKNFTEDIFNTYTKFGSINTVDGEDFLNVKTMVNTLIKHRWENNVPTLPHTLTDVGVPELEYYAEEYDVENQEHIGSVHGPLSMKDNKFCHSYNLSNNLINVGYKAYAPVTGNEDALLLHFKYRSLEEWTNKCEKKLRNKVRFQDISAFYYNAAYTTDKIVQMYNLVKPNLLDFNSAAKLFNEYKTKYIGFKAYLTQMGMI